jgi:hypothetical protein
MTGRSEYSAWLAMHPSRYPVRAVPIGKRSLLNRIRKFLGV